MSENIQKDPWKSGANPPTSYASRRVTSELAPSEIAGPAKVVAAGATGSLPVSSAEALCRSLEKQADEAAALSSAQDNGYTRGWNDGRSAGLARAAKQLRWIAGLTTERQPEENTASEPRPLGKDSKTP